MKICFMLSDSNTKGANGAFLEFIDALLSHKELEFCIFLPSRKALTRELNKREISYFMLPYKWWMHVEGSPRWKVVARAILNIFLVPFLIFKIKKCKCDIIYTNTLVIGIGAFAAKILKLPHIWHIHEFGYEDHKLIFSLGKKFSYKLINYSSVLIANSYAVAKKFSDFIDIDKIKVVYCSVPLDPGSEYSQLPKQKKSKFQCAIVGRLAEGKRQEDAIRAMSYLVNKCGYKDIGLWIIGDGDIKYSKYLRNLVATEKLGRTVEFLGYVENPVPYIKLSDAMIMCSRAEGFGIVTVEAMLMGRPVIGAASGATPELIRDGFNGLLYETENYRDLAKKIEYLYKNKDIAEKLGVNGRQWAMKRFTRKVYGEEIFMILKSTLGSKKLQL